MRRMSGILAVAALLANSCILRAQEQQAPATPPQTQASSQRTQDPSASPVPSPKVSPEALVVPAGTRLPLVLHNAVTTRNARPGDPVYLETLFPISIKGRILIPAGTYVQGEIQEAKRPGKVIGAGVGAAVGLAGVLLTRGPEMELPRGTTVDIITDRAIYLDASRVNFTDPGRASTLPGPSNRVPARNNSPF